MRYFVRQRELEGRAIRASLPAGDDRFWEAPRYGFSRAGPVLELRPLQLFQDQVPDWEFSLS